MTTTIRRLAVAALLAVAGCAGEDEVTAAERDALCVEDCRARFVAEFGGEPPATFTGIRCPTSCSDETPCVCAYREWVDALPICEAVEASSCPAR